MPRSYTVTRTLAAALAIGAIAAPAALARPVQDFRMPDTKDAAAQSQRGQDMRMPDTKDAAAQSQRAEHLRRVLAGSHIHTSSLAGTTDRGPVYWTYDHPAPDPKLAAALAQEHYYSTSVRPAPVQQPAGPGGSDDGTPWALIGLGLAGAALATAGAAGIAGKTRVRDRRARVAA
jgi:hypothetical protein